MQKSDQASDYYLAIFDSKENKAYTIPITSAYQFTQVIETFQDEINEARGQMEPVDNEAIKNMSFMDKKLQLVNAFGTKKSQKKVTSMLTNMVDEGGITHSANKGVRDQRLAEKALYIANDQEALTRDLLTLSERRQHLYSREKLLPYALLEGMPYKKTFDALRTENEEELRSLILNSAIRLQLQNFYANKFNNLANNKEKKFALRGFIYLDCLVAFFRLPIQIESSPSFLASKLKTVQPVIDHLLSQFSQATVMTMKSHSKNNDGDTAVPSGTMGFKHVKGKDNQKDLVCHMIAIMGFLTKEFRGQVVAKLIKKELTELRSYFQELGFTYDPIKEDGQDDYVVKFNGAGLYIQKPQEEVQPEKEQVEHSAPEITAEMMPSKRRKTNGN